MSRREIVECDRCGLEVTEPSPQGAVRDIGVEVRQDSRLRAGLMEDEDDMEDEPNFQRFGSNSYNDLCHGCMSLIRDLLRQIFTSPPVEETP